MDSPKPLRPRLLAGSRAVIALDLRSLAAFRIFAGLVILLDLASRASEIGTFHSDTGPIPRSLVISKSLMPWQWSLYLMNGEPFFAGLLFATAAFFAIVLILGWHTRIVTVINWFLLVSLQHRNPLIIQSGDLLLRCLLFWAMFLPLGSRFSIDSRDSRPLSRTPEREDLASAATAAFIIQLTSIYLLTAQSKFGQPSWREGLGVFHALHTWSFTTDFGRMAGSWPPVLLKMASHATLVFEFFVPPLLLLTPLWNPLRGLVVAAYILYHLSLYLFLKVGLFGVICITGWLALIPSAFWSRYEPRLARWAGVARDRFDEKLRRFRAGIPPLRALVTKLTAPVLVLLTCYTLWWNLANASKSRTITMPYSLRSIGYLLALDQIWNMFEKPFVFEGWFVIPGRLANGMTVDLYSNTSPVDWSEPDSLSAIYRGDRHRKYMLSLISGTEPEFFNSFGKSLCFNWNTTHGGAEALESFYVVRMQFAIHEPPAQRGKPFPLILWRHECFAGAFSKFPVTVPQSDLPKTGG